MTAAVSFSVNPKNVWSCSGLSVPHAWIIRMENSVTTGNVSSVLIAHVTANRCVGMANVTSATGMRSRRFSGVGWGHLLPLRC